MFCASFIASLIHLSVELGKSYTVTGTPTEPGLLPRALDVVFSSLDLQQQLSEVKVRPERFSELRYLKESEQEEAQLWKGHILDLVSESMIHNTVMVHCTENLLHSNKFRLI